MATDMKRLSLTLTPEIEARLNSLKREQYYNKSNAEMLRDIISRGLECEQRSVCADTG